jgi:hypothetical protein
LIDLTPKQEIDDEWEQIKAATVDAARDIVQTQSKPPRNEWWDEECKKIIQDKNKARKKWLQMKTRISWNTYINKTKQANKICIQKKKKWLSSKITQTEENHRKNETKKFFEGILNCKQQVTLPIICQDAKDNVVSQSYRILAGWKDYFCKMFNISEATDIQNIIREDTNNPLQIPLPSYNKICFIINKLKLNKAAGSDIPPELLKHGGRTLRQKLHKLILTIWNNEQLPQQRNEGIICPV